MGPVRIRMFENADVIHSYTRKQAIEDGVLVDVTKVAGYRLRLNNRGS